MPHQRLNHEDYTQVNRQPSQVMNLMPMSKIYFSRSLEFRFVPASSTDFPETNWRNGEHARAGDKQEAREGGDGNKHRGREGSDGEEKERKGKLSGKYTIDCSAILESGFAGRFTFSSLSITPFVLAFHDI